MAERTIPWHASGTKLSNPPSVGEALKQAGLNWAVLKTGTFNGWEPLPGRKFVVREDLWSKREGGLLGTIRENDEPMQMLEAFGFLDSIVTAEAASYDAAGAFGEYTWPWMILRLSGDSEVVPGDPIGRFVLFLHSPASGHYRLSYLPVRLAGANTVAREDFHNPDPRVTIPNDRPRRFEAPLSAVLQELHRQFDERIEEFRAMARIQLDQDILQRYLNVAVDRWLNNPSRRIRIETEAMEAQRTTHLQECVRLFEDGKGNNLSSVKGTLWAACSAVTEYVDFFKLDRDDPNYLDGVWFDRLKHSAVRTAIELTRAGVP